MIVWWIAQNDIILHRFSGERFLFDWLKETKKESA